jgi:transaldolase
MVEDVRNACDVLAGVFERSRSVDGRVSLEVDPRLAFDTVATIAAARRIWADVDRPNVMVKIPATRAGLPAITETLASGISVNVTLIFGIDRYLEVQEAWIAGLRAAQANGHDLAAIGSVASFFVSRLDSAVDARLDAMATSGTLDSGQHQRLRGRAAVANARNAYRAYRQMLTDSRWQALSEAGAQSQRPLWASTSTKDPSFSPTRYVDELVAPQTVNTMPSATLTAIAAATAEWPTAIGLTDADAQVDASLFADLEAVGIEYAQVVVDLEEAGVASFIDAWNTLLELVASVRRG